MARGGGLIFPYPYHHMACGREEGAVLLFSHPQQRLTCTPTHTYNQATPVWSPGKVQGLMSHVQQLPRIRAISYILITLKPVLSPDTSCKGQGGKDMFPSATPPHGRQSGVWLAPRLSHLPGWLTCVPAKMLRSTVLQVRGLKCYCQ